MITVIIFISFSCNKKAIRVSLHSFLLTNNFPCFTDAFYTIRKLVESMNVKRTDNKLFNQILVIFRHYHISKYDRNIKVFKAN